MKPGFNALLLIVVTLAFQRVLAVPQSPVWATAILLPMPWIIGPPLLNANRRWYAMSFVVGLIWDALFEPVIGPGAISWSCAAAVAWVLASIVVNRGPRAWFAFGALAVGIFWVARLLTQSLLGLNLMPRFIWLGGSALATGALCAVVGWLLRAEIPRHWKTFRARRLH